MRQLKNGLKHFIQQKADESGGVTRLGYTKMKM